MRQSELVRKSKWDRTGRPYPIREVIKEVRRQESEGGGGRNLLRDEAFEAINYGAMEPRGETGYVMTQTRKRTISESDTTWAAAAMSCIQTRMTGRIIILTISIYYPPCV
eukprot:SAG22_NODE_1070_length_5723_cov_2.407539_4_plen_110_part_00